MLLYIAIGLLCFALGLHLSHFGPQHQTLIRRLKNINEVAEDSFNGLVKSDDAILFITLESNLNIADGKYKVIRCSGKKSCLNQFKN